MISFSRLLTLPSTRHLSFLCVDLSPPLPRPKLEALAHISSCHVHPVRFERGEVPHITYRLGWNPLISPTIKMSVGSCEGRSNKRGNIAQCDCIELCIYSLLYSVREHIRFSKTLGIYIFEGSQCTWEEVLYIDIYPCRGVFCSVDLIQDLFVISGLAYVWMIRSTQLAACIQQDEVCRRLLWVKF